MTGKGSTYRKVKWQQFENNYDRIFGKQNETIEAPGPRESVRFEYTESDRTTFGGHSYFQEGSVRYSEYNVQYHPPSEDN